MVDEPVALLFDVFGTVVDWRGSVVACGAGLTRRTGVEIDWGTFADQWRREAYLQPIIDMATGKRPWSPVFGVMASELGPLLARHGGEALDADARGALLAVWRRLRPWPDAVAGLTRLRARFIVGPLSNAGFAMLAEMANAAGLPWDCVISAELFGAYKPDPAAYLGAARLLDLEPGQIMLVAAHPFDLDAARGVGMRTGYVPRPEWGPDAPFPPEGWESAPYDVVAPDFAGLAGRLGA